MTERRKRDSDAIAPPSPRPLHKTMPDESRRHAKPARVPPARPEGWGSAAGAVS